MDNKFNQLLRGLGENLQRNSPAILTALSVVGLGTTTILAIKATGPAIKAVEQFEMDYEQMYDEPPDKLDYIKLLAPYYATTIASGVLTAICIVGANKIIIDRYGTLAALYSTSQRTLYEYQEKVEETFGKKKARRLQDDMAQDKLLKNPVEGVHIYTTGKGQHLCYDSWSGRYFRGDIEAIRRAENEFNSEILQGDGFKTLNELYADIGLEPVEGGQQMGWSLDTDMLRIRFTAKITTEGEPCIVLEFPVNPRYL